MELYGTQRWRRLARDQLRREPLCAMCLQEGQIVAGTVADHVIPHRGDEGLFWSGKLQSLCKRHHDTSKQIEEHRGFRTDIGEDGWPIDSKHPVYRAGQGGICKKIGG
jgi:5-methylcytosine-specific restriction protein A